MTLLMEKENGLVRCAICMQNYMNRTYVSPCYHSFCFNCILQWINTPASDCPLCRQTIESLIYNVNVEENTMDEYFLKDKGNKKTHDPPIEYRKKTKIVLGLKKDRKLVYEGRKTVETFPAPLDRYATLTIIKPEHIPRTRIFLEHELPLVTGIQDTFVVDQILNVLLTPYHTHQTSMDPVLHEVADWLSCDDTLAIIFLQQLMGFLKSGLSYSHFISAVKYSTINEE